ncbi:PRD domain-containing protein [Paramicrobacterium sp. CJ85]|uniref:PRD domain-containing protein n=1 Tax=Paramicrobacterium sp. CJ85 TaxID=3445355 RepID=UPI003F614D3A
MRIIKRVFNNNVVSAVGKDGNDVILVGSGLGYLAKKGMKVHEDRVEREFHLTGLGKDGAFRILLEIPTPVIAAVSALVKEVRTRFNYTLTPAAEVALADHLAQAIERSENGENLPNPMLWDTRTSYPQEYLLAERMLAIVETSLGVQLPEDEAGFVALHFVNAGIFSGSQRALSHSAALSHVLEIIRNELDLDLPPNSPITRRFVTHLKFVMERITSGRTHAGTLDPVFESLRENHPDARACAARVSDYLQEEFSEQLSDEEDFYLMLHLIRARDAFAAEMRPPESEQ